jgi:hypothetical protein
MILIVPSDIYDPDKYLDANGQQQKNVRKLLNCPDLNINSLYQQKKIISFMGHEVVQIYDRIMIEAVAI